jgi:putative tryptophan/tyrosine transport system substrate-binding protein
MHFLSAGLRSGIPLFLTLLLAGSSQQPRLYGQPGGRVLVFSSAGVPAYSEAIEGIREELAQDGYPVDVETSGTLNAARFAGTSLVIAVGDDALKAALRSNIQAPIVATLVTHADLVGAERRYAGAVSVDISLPDVLASVKRLFPERTRIGILRDAARDSEAVVAKARQQGFTIEVLDCTKPDELLRSIPTLRDKIDFLLSRPDSHLFNSTTANPILLSALQNRLPLIGFSESFVRAGAAVGVYPNYRRAGRQTAAMAKRVMQGDSRSIEPPKVIDVAVNGRVLSLLGLEYRQARPGRGELVVLR